MFVWSYKEYTIVLIKGKYFITYPTDESASVYTYALEKAYEFIDMMVGE